MTERIIVYDHSGILEGHGTAPWHIAYWLKKYEEDKKELKRLEVDAYCVGGDDGVLAFFYYNNKFCIAAGDDGNWWLMYACDHYWALEFKEVAEAIKISFNKR